MAIALRFPAVDPVPISSVSGQNNTYRRRYGTIIDTNFARLLDGGQLAVRYVTADVPMAACRSAANQNAVAGIVLKSNIFSEVAHIDLRCGGGHGSVMFGFAAEAEGHFQLSPSVGDVLRVSIFRNVAECRDEFTATNTRTNNSKMVTVAPRARWSTVSPSRAPPSPTSPVPGHRPPPASGCGNPVTSPSPATTARTGRSAARGRPTLTWRRR
jgi:hypothetical protein